MPDTPYILHALSDEIRTRQQFHVYTGPSMNPTLREPDILEVSPYLDRKPLVGDVIVYRDPDGERVTVHRVIRITAEGLRTQGDNNTDMDLFLIKEQRVFGRVDAALCGNRRRPLVNGAAGARYGRQQRQRRKWRQCLRRCVRPLYLFVARLPVWRWFLPPSKRPRLVVFGQGDAACRRLLMGRNIIGRFDAVRKIWEIRAPYHLFVNSKYWRQNG